MLVKANLWTANSMTTLAAHLSALSVQSIDAESYLYTVRCNDGVKHNALDNQAMDLQ